MRLRSIATHAFPPVVDSEPGNNSTNIHYFNSLAIDNADGLLAVAGARRR